MTVVSHARKIIATGRDPFGSAFFVTFCRLHAVSRGPGRAVFLAYCGRLQGDCTAAVGGHARLAERWQEASQCHQGAAEGRSAWCLWTIPLWQGSSLLWSHLVFNTKTFQLYNRFTHKVFWSVLTYVFFCLKSRPLVVKGGTTQICVLLSELTGFTQSAGGPGVCHKTRR